MLVLGKLMWVVLLAVPPLSCGGAPFWAAPLCCSRLGIGIQLQLTHCTQAPPSLLLLLAPFFHATDLLTVAQSVLQPLPSCCSASLLTMSHLTSHAVSAEASILCNAVAWCDPQATAEALLVPLLRALSADVAAASRSPAARLSKVRCLCSLISV